MKEERDEDKQEVKRFFKSISAGDPEKMASEDKIEILRGTVSYLLLQLQQVYIFMSRNSAVPHDNLLYRSMGDVLSETEEMLDSFFPDYQQFNFNEEIDNVGD